MRTKKLWQPRTERERFAPGGELPNVFSTFERTKLVAFLCASGPANVQSLVAAFNVHQQSMVLRLQAAERSGLVQRTISVPGYSTYNHINIRHPAYPQIFALVKSLATSSRYRPQAHSCNKTPCMGRYDTRVRRHQCAGRRRQFTGDGEILLFLATLGESASISRLSGVLSRARYSVQLPPMVSNRSGY